MKISKKILLITVFLLFTILLNGCMFKKIENVSQIVIADKVNKTIVFVKSADGSSDRINFVTKIKDGNMTYLEEGKIHNGEFVFKRILEDRDFEVLNLYDNNIYLKNKDGLQEIIYEFRSSYYKNNIISDMLVSFKTDGFGEVIKGLNSNQYLETTNSANSKIMSDVDNSNIWALGTYKNKVIEATKTLYDKKQYYVYEKGDNLLVSETLHEYELLKTTGGDTITQEIVNTKEINTILKDCFEIKKVVLSNWQDKTYIYVIDYNENIFCYDIKNKVINVTDAYSDIDEIAQFEDNIYILSNNTITVLNHNLDEKVTCVLENNEEVLGITWYKDYSNSTIKYIYIKNNELVIKDV